MAENTGNPALEVEIGGDVSKLQVAIIAAENELRGFQAEIRKTTDTGKIAELSKSIQLTEQRIAGMRQEMGKSAGASNQAVNALGNVSRVAQDASYGFMGIANNLNPLFESFQRLQASSGGTGNALKQMGAALTGPAGIGLAIGVVSSLIVSFGDDLTDFVNSKLSGFTDAMKLEAGVFKEAQQGYVKATEDINNLNQAHDDYTNGIISKEQFLKQFNSTLGDTIKKTDDLATAEKFLRDGAEQYIQMMYYKAVATEALNQAAKKQIEALQEQNAPLQPTLVQRAVSFLAPAGSKDAEQRAEDARKEKIDQLGYDAIVLKDIAENYKTLGDNIQYNLTKIFGAPAGNETKGPDAFKEYMAQQKYELQKALNDMETWRKKFDKLNLKPILTVFNPEEDKAEEKRKQYFNKKNKELLDESNKSGLGDFLTKDATKRAAKYKQEDKQIKELTDAYENFANMLASSVTSGIMDVFNAFEQGKDPLQAIGDMFLNIAKNIAAAVLQATIFEAILTQFPELKAIFAASGALQSAFGGKRLAAGGITNGASIAMIGEAGPEAVLPLSKLNSFMNTSFNAGAMSGGGASGGGGGYAVLRGQDILVAINRTQKASALKGQNISLI
jgi:hypothetical protein